MTRQVHSVVKKRKTMKLNSVVRDRQREVNSVVREWQINVNSDGEIDTKKSLFCRK